MKNILLISMLLLAACSGGPYMDEDPQNAPEAILRRYQHLVDINRFEEAKELSTPAEQARLNQLAEEIAGDLENYAILNTEFLNINCEVNGKKARCRCLIEDDYERYQAEYMLVRGKNGHWLVDAPEGEGSGREGEMLEKALESAFTN